MIGLTAGSSSPAVMRIRVACMLRFQLIVGGKSVWLKLPQIHLSKQLRTGGVEVIFGLPGDGINGIMESLRQRKDKIRFIQVRREEAVIDPFVPPMPAKITIDQGSKFAQPLARDEPL